ncbi:hypothetical protein [Parashewanella curva]|nr:hypothetical protein [Parashewanella curva]
MQHPHFKAFKRGDITADNQWHHYCFNHQVPFISVKYRTKLADVEFRWV